MNRKRKNGQPRDLKLKMYKLNAIWWWNERKKIRECFEMETKQSHNKPMGRMVDDIIF